MAKLIKPGHYVWLSKHYANEWPQLAKTWWIMAVYSGSRTL